MPIIHFTKMHGLGNDYIYIDTEKYPIPDPSACALRWSNRRCGIGADGLVLIGKSTVADRSMRIFNADGSEAEICGNALRCVGKYLYDRKLVQKREMMIETLAGVRALHVDTGKDGTVNEVTVEMGRAEKLSVLLPGGISSSFVMQDIEAAGRKWTGTAVSMGNPHLVLVGDSIETDGLEEAGRTLSQDAMFAAGANVEFVQVLDKWHLKMRVYERGSGMTAACGSGACAAAAVCFAQGAADSRGCNVIMDGGCLSISRSKDGMLLMRGHAVTVFEGYISL